MEILPFLQTEHFLWYSNHFDKTKYNLKEYSWTPISGLASTPAFSAGSASTHRVKMWSNSNWATCGI